MAIKDTKTTVLARLYKLYEDGGFGHGMGLERLEADIRARPGAVEVILKEFRRRGWVTFAEDSNELSEIELTSEGVEAYEDPQSEIGPYVQQHVTIHGGNNQLGDGNMQNVTYQTVLTHLASAIEASDDIPTDKKHDWSTKLREIAAHPLTQTILAAAAGAAAGAR